jgi:hypothetical protein
MRFDRRIEICSVATSFLDGVGAGTTVALAEAEVPMYSLGDASTSAALVISLSTATLGLEPVALSSA